MTRLYDKLARLGEIPWTHPPGVFGDPSFTASIEYADDYVWVTVCDQVTGHDQTNWFPMRQAAVYGDKALARMIEHELRSLVDKLKVRRQPMMKWQCPVELEEEFWLA